MSDTDLRITNLPDPDPRKVAESYVAAFEDMEGGWNTTGPVKHIINSRDVYVLARAYLASEAGGAAA